MGRVFVSLETKNRETQLAFVCFQTEKQTSSMGRPSASRLSVDDGFNSIRILGLLAQEPASASEADRSFVGRSFSSPPHDNPFETDRRCSLVGIGEVNVQDDARAQRQGSAQVKSSAARPHVAQLASLEAKAVSWAQDFDRNWAVNLDAPCASLFARSRKNHRNNCAASEGSHSALGARAESIA